MEVIMKLQKISLLAEELKMLAKISRSRTHSIRMVQRAQIILYFFEGKKINDISKSTKCSRPTIYKCIKKALAGGALH